MPNVDPQVFDDFERTDVGSKLRSESRFSFLNRTAVPRLAQLRLSIDDWFCAFPTGGAADIRGRLRSGREDQFDSAFYELALNKVFCTLGFTTSLHPDLPNTTKRNDFVLQAAGESQLFIEAIVPQQPPHVTGTETRRKSFLDELDLRLQTLGFWLGVVVRAVPPESTSPKKFARFVERRLDNIDRDELFRRVGEKGLRAADSFVYEEDGWLIEVSVYPRGAVDPAINGTRIGMEMTQAGELDNVTPVLQALEKKATKYGEFDGPYVIAVNSNDMFADQRDILSALFGRETINLTRETGPITIAGSSRSFDGFWIRNNRPRHQQVSGVLFTTRMNPANILSATAQLYLNPYALRPYSGILTGLPTSIPVEDHYDARPGLSVQDLLGLSVDLDLTEEH
jgi:hypothetical protein